MRKQFDWDLFGHDVDEEIGVLCKTKDEAEDFCKESHRRGLDWSAGNSRGEETFWNGEAVTYTRSRYTEWKTDLSFLGIKKVIPWSDYMGKRIVVKIDPEDPKAAHKAVNDAIKAYQVEEREKARAWTPEEIAEATRITDKLILDLHHRGFSPVFYEFPEEIRVTLRIGYPATKSKKDCGISTPKGYDIFNREIGRCVALCKATGTKIPDFIVKKNNIKED